EPVERLAEQGREPVEDCWAGRAGVENIRRPVPQDGEMLATTEPAVGPFLLSPKSSRFLGFLPLGLRRMAAGVRLRSGVARHLGVRLQQFARDLVGVDAKGP